MALVRNSLEKLRDGGRAPLTHEVALMLATIESDCTGRWSGMEGEVEPRQLDEVDTMALYLLIRCRFFSRESPGEDVREVLEPELIKR